MNTLPAEIHWTIADHLPDVNVYMLSLTCRNLRRALALRIKNADAIRNHVQLIARTLRDHRICCSDAVYYPLEFRHEISLSCGASVSEHNGELWVSGSISGARKIGHEVRITIIHRVLHSDYCVRIAIKYNDSYRKRDEARVIVDGMRKIAHTLIRELHAGRGEYSVTFERSGDKI